MSSRDRRNRPQQPRRDSRMPPRDDRTSASEGGYDDVVEFEPLNDEPTSVNPIGSGRSSQSSRQSSSREGTAEQINRLRQSLSPGSPRRTQSTTRQSIGRNYLSRPEPEAAAPANEGDYDDFDEDDVSQAEEPTYRPIARQRTDVLRRDPYVTSGDDEYGSGGTPAYQDDEDPYYDDDDDFTEYDAPRSTAWQRASSPRGGAQRQPVSRPTLPPAITQADLVNDAAALSIIGVGLLSLAAMAIVVANQADSLAPSFATHVSASGVLEDFRSSNGLWRLPLLSTMLTLMNVVAAWFISPLDRFASRFLLAAAVVVQLVAWVALVRIL